MSGSSNSLSLNTVVLLSHLQVPKDAVEDLVKHGVKITIGIKGLTISHEGKVYGECSDLTSAQMAYILSGDQTPTPNMTMQVNVAVCKVLKAVLKGLPDYMLDLDEGKKMTKKLNMKITPKKTKKMPLGAVTPKSMQIGSDTWEPWGIYPEVKMEPENRVPLKDAKELYVPVYSTSEGSTYFLVAGLEDLRIAARWKGSKLSIRVEGDVGKYASRIKAAGIPHHGAYASIHIGAIKDKKMCSRVLGAVLGGLDLCFNTAFPQASVLYGKGT